MGSAEPAGCRSDNVAGEMQMHGIVCKCTASYDLVGHHIQTCTVRNMGTWHRAHALVLNTWKGITRAAKVAVSVESSRMPRLALDPLDQHADILLGLHPTGGTNCIVGDVSITHPFIGKGKKQQWGQHIPHALNDRVNTKNCAAPACWMLDDAVRVCDIDYGEDLPLGPSRASVA